MVNHNYLLGLTRELKYDRKKFEKMDKSTLIRCIATLYTRYNGFREAVINVYLENEYLRRKHNYEQRRTFKDELKHEE